MSYEQRQDLADGAIEVRRSVPLWFAGTCLLGALCQPDVQATMRPELPSIEAWSPVPIMSVTTMPAHAEPLPVTPAALADLLWAPAAQDEGRAAPSAAVPTLAYVETRAAPRSRASTAPVPPTLPADGRLLSAFVLPAQEALARHIAATWRVDARRAGAYVARTWNVAEELDLDPFLMLAIMAVESSFDPTARSGQGAQGLMQVHTRMHAEKFKPYGGVARAFDPEANIRVGGRILRDYLDRYETPRAALKAYVGAARLKSDGGYSAKVLKQHGRFRDVVTTELARLAAERLTSGADRRRFGPAQEERYATVRDERYVSASAAR